MRLYLHIPVPSNMRVVLLRQDFLEFFQGDHLLAVTTATFDRLSAEADTRQQLLHKQGMLRQLETPPSFHLNENELSAEMLGLWSANRIRRAVHLLLRRRLLERTLYSRQHSFDYRFHHGLLVEALSRNLRFSDLPEHSIPTLNHRANPPVDIPDKSDYDARMT